MELAASTHSSTPPALSPSACKQILQTFVVGLMDDVQNRIEGRDTDLSRKPDLHITKFRGRHNAGTSPRINLRSFHTLAPCHIEKWRRTCLKRRNLEHAEHERKLRDDTASLELDAHIDKVHKVVHWEWKKATSRLDLNELRLEKILQQGAVVDVAEQVCAGLMSSKDFLKNWENPKHRDVDGHYGAVLHWQTRRLDPWAVMICEGDKQKMKDPPVEGGAYKDEDGVWVRDGPIFEPLNDDDYEADYDRLRRVLLGLPETPQGDSEVSVPEDMDTTW